MHEIPERTEAAHEIRTRSEKHDFDFLDGSWIVENRRLPEPFAGEQQPWRPFHTVHRLTPLANRSGYLHEIEGDAAGSGVMLHLFDAVEDRWITRAISAEGLLENPMRGSFRLGVGIFTGRRLFRQRLVLVRHVWTRTATSTPEWTQSFSKDGGETWELNWTMRFVRAEWPD